MQFPPSPATDSENPRWQPVVLALSAVILVAALVPFVYTGTFVRYQADDYCSAQLLRTLGFWGAQVESYTGWSNRFSTMLATGLIDPLGVLGIQILPGLLVAGLVASVYWLLRRLRFLFEVQMSGLLLFYLAGMVTFFALYTLPSRFQSLYWRSGSITYTLPVIGLLILLAVLVGRREKPAPWWQLILTGLLSFFAAGFSETNAALQIGLLALGLVGVLWYEGRSHRSLHGRSLWIAALAGCGLGVVVILMAPGNAVRMSAMPAPPGFLRWLTLSLRYGWDFLYSRVAGAFLPWAVSFLLSFALALLHPWKEGRARTIAWGLLIVPVTVYLLEAAICAPSVYAQSAYPEERALAGANFILTAGVIAEGFLLGALSQAWRVKFQAIYVYISRVIAAGAVVVLSVYLVYAGSQILQDVADYRVRAEGWDKRAAQIEQLQLAGDLNPVVPALDSIGTIGELSADPSDWVNRCAAAYYQVETITAK